MTTPDEQARKLRHVEAAAWSAVANGVDPDEVRRRVEAGIADAIEHERGNAERAAWWAGPRDTPPPIPPRKATAPADKPAAAGSAIAAMAAAVDAL